MTLLGKLANPTATTQAVNPALGDPRNIMDPDTILWLQAFFGRGTTTGKTVTVERAVGIPTVWSCLRLLTDAIGSMPLETFDRTTGGGRTEAFSSPMWRLLRDRPNPEMTGTLLWRLVLLHLNTWGNAYIGKTFYGNDVVELWPIRPDRVRVARTRGVKEFYLRDAWGRELATPYTTADLIHIQGISFDGVMGISPIEAAREAFGLGLALEEYTNKFFANGAVPRVVLQKKEGTLSGDAAARLGADWKSRYGGSKNAHATAVLEEGLEAKVLSFPLKDLQFVEQMQWGAADAARVFRVPLTKLGIPSGDSMTYRTVDSDSIDFVTFSMLGWTTLIEQAILHDDDLFPVKPNRPSQFAAFKLRELFRADLKSQGEYFERATGGRAWLHPSEARAETGYKPDAALDAAPAPGTPPAIALTDNNGPQ